MELLKTFRDPAHVRTLAALVREAGATLAQQWQRPVQVMEVCGGHTHAIYKAGLHQLVGDQIEFLHGPGCPVCVLPKSRIDSCIAMAQQADVILATYGDVMRVPGTALSFIQAKALGADIRMVYSALDALRLAQRNPHKRVVFFALGFETTMPATALTLQQARHQQVQNFFVYCHHILIVPALTALLKDQDTLIDGFIGPGHVSAVLGTAAYDFIAAEFRKPFVIAGFEPVDILQSLLMVLRQLQQGRCAVEVQYNRVVTAAGNPVAQAALADVFRVAPHSEWRGLGVLEQSGLMLQPAYAQHDAALHFQLEERPEITAEAGRCGAVLKGQIKPAQCELFGNQCTPQHPVGALMVSSEGACSACYQHA